VRFVPVNHRAAIFDLDGTLVDSRQDLVASGNHARRSLALPELPFDTVVGFIGDGVDRLVQRLIADADPGLHAQALRAFEAHYHDHCCVATAAFDGIPELLGRLRGQAWHIGVATNKPRAFTAMILDHCRLSSLVDDVRGGDTQRKPDPGQLLSLFAGFEALPRSSWMIGDHHTDIRAAQAAGCRMLWCGWGFGNRDGLAVDAVAADPREVAAVLDS
jgi:phosphoglycolate phosphatase